MSDEYDNDSDAPEEFTAVQGFHQDEEIRRIQINSKARVVREKKERRRLWAQRKTPRAAKEPEKEQEGVESEADKDDNSLGTRGMLPNDIVNLLAAREKQVFSSDSEDENKAEAKPLSRKKKFKLSGSEPVILKDIPPPQCLQNSLDFLKKRKMQVPRSAAVLNHSNQALRFLSSSGLLSKK